MLGWRAQSLALEGVAEVRILGETARRGVYARAGSGFAEVSVGFCQVSGTFVVQFRSLTGCSRCAPLASLIRGLRFQN